MMALRDCPGRRIARLWLLGLVPPPRPLTAEEKAKIRHALDSLGFTIRQQDGTTEIHGPPAFDSLARRLGEGIQRAAYRAMLVLAAIFLPIPLTLTAITIWWLIVRRRGLPEASAT